jgi:hypothetical protein
MNTYGTNAGYGYPAQINTNNQTFKINPQVMTLIEPIIRTMTQYQQYQKVSSAYGMWNPMNSVNEGQKKQIEDAKKNCVHLIRNESGDIEPTLEDMDENFFKCRLCGRLIYKKFDKSASDKINDAIPVLNMLIFFGMTMNLGPEQVSNAIFLKHELPAMAQLVDALNIFVKEEDQAITTAGNVGQDSLGAVFQGPSILGFGGRY